MRTMSWQRRRVVALGSSLACMSGVVPVLLRSHRKAEWVWLGLEAVLMVWLMVLMVRLQRSEGCG